MNFYEGLAKMECDGQIFTSTGCVTVVNLEKCEDGLYPFYDSHTGEKKTGSYSDVYEFKV